MFRVYALKQYPIRGSTDIASSGVQNFFELNISNIWLPFFSADFQQIFSLRFIWLLDPTRFSSAISLIESIHPNDPDLLLVVVGRISITDPSVTCR